MTTPYTYTAPICNECRLFHANGDLPDHMSDDEIKAFVKLCGTPYADGVAMAVVDQWSDGYDEFSVARCYSCNTTSGGERYQVTYTEIVQVQHVHDLDALRPLTVWSLIHDGQPAGSILWHMEPDVETTCTVHITRGSLATKMQTTSASGSGYCIRSAALSIALSRLGDDIGLNGLGDAKNVLSTAGYTIGEVI